METERVETRGRKPDAGTVVELWEVDVQAKNSELLRAQLQAARLTRELNDLFQRRPSLVAVS